MKRSFILHLDSLEILNEMPNEMAGLMLKAMYQYHTDGTLPNLDFATKMALHPFIKQFDRDIEKYNETCERNRQNGNKGGRPQQKPTKTEENPKNPSGFSENPKNPSKPDNDSDSKKDSENKSDSGNGNEIPKEPKQTPPPTTSKRVPDYLVANKDVMHPELYHDIERCFLHGEAITYKLAIGRNKQGYMFAARLHPDFDEKCRLSGIPPSVIDNKMKEWAVSCFLNKSEQSWQTYADMFQHSINFMKRDLPSKRKGLMG